MTDRPIIFSAQMIRALLDGRTSMTRRVLKEQRHFAIPDFTGGRWQWLGYSGAILGDIRIPCAPGDRLWVREAWRVGAWHYHNAEIAVDYCDGPRKEWLGVDDSDMLYRLIDQSRADAAKAKAPLRESYYEYTWPPGNSPCRWRPSIHMPRWASRLTMTVTEVRVQRVQEISAEDVIAEGVQCGTCEAMNQSACHGRGCFASIEAFRDLWNSIHGPGAWDANPWVAAISFTVERRNIDARAAA